jgi:hypothetical protein
MNAKDKSINGLSKATGAAATLVNKASDGATTVY